MNKLFADAIESNQGNLKYYADQISLLAVTSGSFDGISEMDDVCGISISKYEKTTNITFYLKDENKDSKLIHKLAQTFGVKFDKTPSYDKQTLRAQGTSNDGLWFFEISNYVPSTCELVTEEIELTPQEIEQAIKNIRTKKTITKVVCA